MNCKIRGSLIKTENPKWPPKIGAVVVIDHPNHRNNLFVGTVQSHLWDRKACLILLINNKEYNDVELRHKGVIAKGSSTNGMLMLLPTHAWKYVNLDEFNKRYGNCVATETVIGPQTQAELTIEATYEDPSKSKQMDCDDDDRFKDTSLLTEKGELQMNDLFGEHKIADNLYDPKERFHPLEVKFRNALLAKLGLGETIPKEESKIIVNKSIAVKNMIETKEDELNEGKKIYDFIVKELVVKKFDNFQLFGDLKLALFNGYIHIARKGIRVDDKITEELVPNLSYFKWQYGIPIDYDTLKYLLFQSEFQRKIQRDLDEQKEAERIFSQEYLIALQPEPRYQMWTLKRLIMMWYGDETLQQNIRKIKVIINQWRCRADQTFNKKYGVLPSIVIYPRYGKQSAKLVLQLISHYFMLYQNIGWSCAQPSYFIKVNDLVWYTNGSLDLKMYFTKALGSYDGKSENKSFNEYFSSLNGADRLMFEPL